MKTRILRFGLLAAVLCAMSNSIFAQHLIIPERNEQVIDSITKYGPAISPTYKKAVCTELLIKIIEKFHELNKKDKSRIRIITNEDIQTLLKSDSPIPKGIYHAFIEKGIGTPIDKIEDVLPGDFVQFWTDTWGHCGVVKSIDLKSETMELYSSFPSTDGYGIQRFKIYKHSFFVRMQ
jgi:hypothetical protein